MRNLRFVFTLILALILHATAARAQQLTVQNEAGKTSVLTRADIEALPHVKVPRFFPMRPRHSMRSRLVSF